MNPLLNILSGKQAQGAGTAVSAGDTIDQLINFAKGYKGDPVQDLQDMINSGKYSQAQIEEAVQKAQLLYKAVGGRLKR